MRCVHVCLRSFFEHQKINYLLQKTTTNTRLIVHCIHIFCLQTICSIQTELESFEEREKAHLFVRHQFLQPSFAFLCA